MKAGEGSKSAAKRVEWGETAFEGKSLGIGIERVGGGEGNLDGIKVLNEERGGENH
jgi:hypothetical protein